jgi:leucyl/phenylalanyl-tRNA--protein transferase
MTSIDDVMIEITPQVLLKAYACGIFPMAESAEDNALYWIEPERRGILPLDRVHVPRRLARTIRRGGFEVRIDDDFDAVIAGCAAPRAGRRSTWINGRIRNLYAELFAMRHCHTVEVWDGGELIGGLYGVHLGRAFFGESMFSKARDASKIALVYLVARLKFGGFELLDTQFLTGHLARFGAIEVRRAEFQRLLEAALYCPKMGNVEGGGAGLGRGGRLGGAAGAGAGPWAAAGAGAGAEAGLAAGAGLGGGGGAASAAVGAGASGAGAAAAGASAAGASAAGAAGAAAFCSLPAGATGSFVLQLVSQTSNTGCSTA